MSARTGEHSTRRYGTRAEDQAATFLEQQGYVMVKRNWRTRDGEVDIIATDGDVLCFVEVKARRSTRYGTAVEAVDLRKQQRLARMALRYLAEQGGERTVRFDVLCQDGAGAPWVLLKDAFRPEAA